MAAEHDLIQKLILDADARRAFLRIPGTSGHGFLVYQDFAPDVQDITNIRPCDLPSWRNVGEFLKFHLMLQVALADGGYSFTVRVRPDLEDQWTREKRDPMDRITRLTRKALDLNGLSQLEYCYVVEARTKRGSRTGLHLHGIFLARDPLVATRFKVAMGKAIAVHPQGRAAAGIALKSGPETDLEPVYDIIDSSPHGRGRWAGYMAKNIMRWDQRFTRRVFISRCATQTVRELWALMREE